MTITGEIRKLARNGQQSTVATFNTGFATGFGFLNSILVDRRGDIYALLDSWDAPGADKHGVWRVRRNGVKELVSGFSPASFPHAMAFDKRGDLFVSDAFLGTIWRITPTGQTSPWLQHPLFMPDPAACPPMEAPFPEGLGGIAFDQHGDMFVTNLNKGIILRVPVNRDGSPGTPSIVAGTRLRQPG